MSKSGFLLLVCGALTFALGSILTSAADENSAKLPDWARRVLEKEFPNTELLRAEREGDRDENRFEAKLRRKDNSRRLSVDLTEAVGVVEIDEELPANELPERVIKGLRRAFPKAEVRSGEKNTDIRVTYTVFVSGGGKKHEVQLSPQGKILEIERRD